jgi:hypothetical protein
MELKFALLADHASETRDGKLNIMGTFDAIWGTEAPAAHPKCFLVARLEASVVEGTEHTFRVSLHDGNGNVAGLQSPDLPLRFVPSGPGRPMIANLVLDLTGLHLPQFDDYEFLIRVDGSVMAEVALPFLQLPQHGES